MKPIFYFVIFLPLAAWGVLRDVANTGKGGSIDLRNRVTGARVAADNQNPYSYKWMRGEPEVFCDPRNEPGALLSKTTVTPWVLANHAIFNSFNYHTTQWFWFFLQYGALALAIIVWMRCHSGLTIKWGIALTLMFCTTPPWRQHIDHGQVYILYTALIMILFWLSQREQTQKVAFTEGLLGAFLFGGRPTFIGQFAEPFKYRRWTSLSSAALGLVIVIVIPILVFGPLIWEQYFEAMATHSEIYLNQMRTPRVRMAYPGTIEGIPLDNIAGVSRLIPFPDTSIYRIISFQLPSKLMLIIWGLLMSSTLLYLVIKHAPTQLLWWAVAAWIVIGDFLLPAYRQTYNDILALPLMLFGISAILKERHRMIWIYSCTFVMALMLINWKIPPSQSWFLRVPSLTTALLAIAAITTSMWTTKKA